MNEPQLDETWDLGEVIAERPQPTDTVTIYLNEVASHEKGKLLKAHSNASIDDVGAIDAKLDEVEKQLDASKYVVHLTAVPSRMREDISSKALHQYPIRADVMGRDDTNNQIARMKAENDMIWHAQITDVVNPEGKHSGAWTLEQIKEFSLSIPTAAVKAIDAAIREITGSAEKFTVASKSVDFS